MPVHISRSAPAHTYHHTSGYIFRLSIPPDLRDIFGKVELRYSLKTGQRGAAKVRAQAALGKIQSLFNGIRNGGRVSKLTTEQINNLVRKYFQQGLDNDEDYRATRNPIDDDKLEEEQDAYSYIKEDIMLDLAHYNYRSVYTDAEKLLAENGITDVTREDDVFKILCRWLMKAQVKQFEIIDKRFLSAHDEIDDILAMPFSALSRPCGADVEAGATLDEVYEKYSIDTRKRCKASSANDILPDVAAFLEVQGGATPIQSIGLTETEKYLEALMQLPSNRKKKKKYRDKSITQLLQMKIPEEDKLSASTINKLMGRVETFFAFAIKRELYTGLNPADDVRTDDETLAIDATAIFNAQDLKMIFTSDEYINDTFKHGWHFWNPILALFTGARQSEIAQLHLSDIRKSKDGTWVFDINPQGTKELKTKTSKRRVPIHDVILKDLNFLKYVKSIKNKGSEQLFPELTPGASGVFGKNVSRWFNHSYMESCGVKKQDRNGRKKAYRSFRKTLSTTLAHDMVDDKFIVQVIGHGDGKKSTARKFYIDPYPPKMIKAEVIDKLKYGIDLSHLKQSKYVIR